MYHEKIYIFFERYQYTYPIKSITNIYKVFINISFCSNLLVYKIIFPWFLIYFLLVSKYSFHYNDNFVIIYIQL